MRYPSAPKTNLTGRSEAKVKPVRFLQSISWKQRRRATTAFAPEDEHASPASSPCAAVLALGVFLALTLHQLNLPGFYYDEALDLVPMLHVMRGEPPELLRNIGIGRFPIMLLDYMGSLGGYLTLPFMALLRAGRMWPRALQPIFFSCVTIVLAWLLARALVWRWRCGGHSAVACGEPIVHLVQPAGHQRHQRDDGVLAGQPVAAVEIENGRSAFGEAFSEPDRGKIEELRQGIFLDSQFFICLLPASCSASACGPSSCSFAGWPCWW